MFILLAPVVNQKNQPQPHHWQPFTPYSQPSRQSTIKVTQVSGVGSKVGGGGGGEG